MVGASAEADQLLPDLKNEGTAAGYVGTYSATVHTNSTATLTITVANTTPAVTGGALTAFAFNAPSVVTGLTVGSSSFTANHLYTNVGTPGPFGTFDYGLSTGSGTWQGGMMARGVAAQATGVFTFNLTGNFVGLTGSQLTDLFLSSFSSGGGNNTPSIFAGRFQGLPRSDTQASTEVHHSGTVPEPSSMLLGGMAIAGIAGFSRSWRGRPAM